MKLREAAIGAEGREEEGVTQAESIGLAALVIEKEEETAVSREFRVSEDENSAKGLQYQVWTSPSLRQIRTLGPPNGKKREAAMLT